ncbi:MAG: MarR family transcriptional regulator [Lachnospiraceae bacterium]|nr:MarR family transcriptional regulator [Lachnospiraceae bacterium]
MEGKDQDTEDNNNRIINKKLSEYNSIIKENEGIYHRVAKKNGISNGAFWILYMMCEEEGKLTQSTVCDTFYQPKQTVNSALKKLAQEGFVELETVAGSHGKHINFTQKGWKFAEDTIFKVITSEQKALDGLTLKEQEEFFRLFRKFTKLLKENMKEI